MQRIYSPILLFFLFNFPLLIFAVHDNEVKNQSNAIKFTENKNQWEKQVLFKADIPGGALFIENTGFTYNLYDGEDLNKLIGHNFDPNVKNSILPGKVKFHGLQMKFSGANPHTKVKGENRSSEYSNYFLGKDKSKWASFAYSYNTINYQNLYNSIHLSLYTSNHTLKYDFHVKPGGNPAEIAMTYEGAERLYIEKGQLHLTTSVNEIIEQKPYAYQIINGKRKEVTCNFILKNNQVSFELPQGYDENYELVIDPVLVFSRSSGSTADNFGMTATYDKDGNFYAGGTAFSNGYPTTIGAYDLTFANAVAYGITDVVITKYTSNGTSRLYSTYLGGNGTEAVNSLIVNEQNELYLYGVTGSSDFPTTLGAYDSIFSGGSYIFFYFNGAKFTNGTDIFVTKFNDSGSGLLGSTYLGGSDNDGLNYNNDTVYFPSYNVYQHDYDSLQFNYGDQFRGEIMLDEDGNCYIGSCTRSADFPIIDGFQATINGSQDGVICKFNPDLTSLIWSSYLGGSDKDAVYAIKVDTAQTVYVTGGTASSNFPTSTSAINQTYQGGKVDGFVSKIKKDGTALLASSFIGTSNYDQSYFLELDRHQNVYLFGQTFGPYPVTPLGIYSNPNSSQFITKINNDLDAVIYSTVFGNGNGNVNISPSAFLVDRCENVYISGWGANILQNTPLTGMPIKNPLTSPPQPTDGFNFYLAAFSRDIDSLIFASYFGGNQSQEHVDGGTSRFDKSGIVYQSVCAGCGGNKDFPSSDPLFPLNMSTNCNNGVFKIDFQITPKVDFEPSVYSGCAPLTVTFNNFSNNIINYFWDFGNGDTTSTEFNPTRTFTDTGTYVIKLIVTDSICNVQDTALVSINVFPFSSVDAYTDKDTLYIGESTQIHAIPASGFNYTWSPATGLNNPNIANPIASPLVTTTYVVTVSDSFCFYQDSVIIYVFEIICDEPNIFIPNAFTPNDDKHNDLMLVRGNNIVELYFVIYNRWGEKVFETTDQAIGWDGTFKGMKADPGVFAYYLTAICIDEQEYFKKGNITLIR